jgi:hypothetical protein
MLLRETVADYCENQMEHTKNIYSVRTSQETHYVSATEPNRLVLFRETVSAYCENQMEHTKNIYSVRTSQGTHYVSATKPNQLMLFAEITAVYLAYHTKHINFSLWAKFMASDVKAVT